MCVPLPFVNDENFKGYVYSFSVMVMLNFSLFMLIACGQVAIFMAIRANAMDAANKDNSNRDAIIARRLTTIIVSDFLCWFPICLLGILAATGDLHLHIFSIFFLQK